MKIRLIVAIVLLVVCIGGALFCMLHAKRCAEDLTQSLETALAAAAMEGENWANATSDALAIWERDRSFYHMLLPHINLNELEWALNSLPKYLERRDQKLYIELCIRAIQSVNTIREIEIPSLGNVF